MPFVLEFEAAGGIGEALTVVQPAIDAGFRTAPDFVEGLIGVGLLAIKINGDERLFRHLAIHEAGGAEGDIVGIPFPGAVVEVIGRVRLIDHRAHAVLGFITIEDLDLEAILQINPAIATFLADEKLDVEAEIPVSFFCDDVCSAIFSAKRDGIITHHGRTLIDGIRHDFPFDGHGGGEAWALPVDPLAIKHFPRAIDDDFRARNGLGTEPELGMERHGEDKKCGAYLDFFHRWGIYLKWRYDL